MSRESPGARVSRVQREYFAMPELAVIARIDSVRSTLRIFQRNAEELRDAVVYHYDAGNLTDIWAVERRPQLQSRLAEIARLLHNFLAAATTLRDHTRRLFQQHYEQQSLLPDYPKRTQVTFRDDPLHNFMEKLRNFFLHVRTPMLTAELRGDTGATHLLITKKVLQRFDGWNSKSREYLEAASWRVDLADACGSYADKVEEFHDWFRAALVRLHQSEVDGVKKKEEELRQAHRDAGID